MKNNDGFSGLGLVFVIGCVLIGLAVVSSKPAMATKTTDSGVRVANSATPPSRGTSLLREANAEASSGMGSPAPLKIEPGASASAPATASSEPTNGDLMKVLVDGKKDTDQKIEGLDKRMSRAEGRLASRSNGSSSGGSRSRSSRSSDCGGSNGCSCAPGSNQSQCNNGRGMGYRPDLGCTVEPLAPRAPAPVIVQEAPPPQQIIVRPAPARQIVYQQAPPPPVVFANQCDTGYGYRWGRPRFPASAPQFVQAPQYVGSDCYGGGYGGGYGYGGNTNVRQTNISLDFGGIFRGQRGGGGFRGHHGGGYQPPMGGGFQPPPNNGGGRRRGGFGNP